MREGRLGRPRSTIPALVEAMLAPVGDRTRRTAARIDGIGILPNTASSAREMLVSVTLDEAHPSDSLAQRDAEVIIIAALSAELGVTLGKASIPTGNGGRVEVDGATEDLSILVEAYAHQGVLRGGQPKKLATDALKLTWIGRQTGAKRLILAVADERVEAYLRRPRAWLTQALVDLGVEVIRVDLDDATSSALVAAQTVQYR